MANQITLIYAGRRWGNSKKIIHAYAKEVDYLLAKDDCDLMFFKAKLGKYDTLGNQIVCEETDSGVKATEFQNKKGYIYIGKLEDEDTLAIWSAADRAAYDVSRQKSIQTKLSTTTYDKAIAELGYIYQHKLPSSSKNSFLVKLLNDIQNRKH